ncbi:MAG: ribonuclease P protein component [Ruminococcus sp.]|nr:ribonuclease P protein component [Ruminococcus sp.]
MLFTTVLKDNRAFQRCYTKGRFAANDFLCVYFYPNKSPYNRLGITVSKKNGGAVERNRVKRIIRAAYRLSEDKLPIGYDIVFVGRKGADGKKSSDVERFIDIRLIKEMNRSFKDGVRKKR